MNHLRLFVFGIMALAGNSLFAEISEEAPSIYLELLNKAGGFQILDFTITELSLSLLILLSALFFRSIIVNSVLKRLEAYAERKERKFYKNTLSRLEKPFSLFILIFGVFLAIHVLSISDQVDLFVTKIYRGASMFVLGWALLRFTDSFVDGLTGHMQAKHPTIVGFLPLIKKSFKILIVIVGTLVVIQNLGYDIGGILATLGIGGAAIAFASKDTISNFFGSLCIVLDRPFKVGDWIEVDGKLNGDVTAIGLRSTRVKTFMATTLSIPNSVLANQTINNWSRMPKRRVKQVVGLSYDTPPDTVNDIVDDIRKLLREDKDINQDFILVNFTDFGESSLDILVYYFSNTTVWLEYLDVRQRINTEIMKIIRARDSSIAFPSRTIYFGENGNFPGDSGLPTHMGDDSLRSA